MVIEKGCMKIFVLAAGLAYRLRQHPMYRKLETEEAKALCAQSL